MPIRPYLSGTVVFEPEAITALSKALDEACIALNVFAGDQRGRETIATRMIDLARNGVVDANALRDRVIAESQIVATIYSTVSNEIHAT